MYRPTKNLLNRDLAEHWNVTERTISNWRNLYGNTILNDDALLSKRLLSQVKVPTDVRELARQRLAPGDEAEFTVGSQAVDAINDLPTLARRTEQHLAEVDIELSRCRKVGDKGGEASQTKLYRELTASLVSIRRTQMLLGQDAGELVAKDDAKRLIHAWASRAAIGIQRVRDSLCRRIIGIQTENAASDILDDTLIDELFLAPFARAIAVPAGVSLPEWFVDEITTAVGDTIAGGESKLKNHKEAQWQSDGTTTTEPTTWSADI